MYWFYMSGPGQPAPTSIQLADGSCVVRRVMDSDNSCMFNAVGYVMEHSRSMAKVCITRLMSKVCDAVVCLSLITPSHFAHYTTLI